MLKGKACMSLKQKPSNRWQIQCSVNGNQLSTQQFIKIGAREIAIFTEENDIDTVIFTNFLNYIQNIKTYGNSTFEMTKS